MSYRTSTTTKKAGSQQTTNGQRLSTTSQPPSSSFMVSSSPLVLTPVSQLDRAPRRSSRTNPPDLGPTTKNVGFGPEDYNPDGSLRTMHRLPGFDQSYAQARNAHYIRHNKPLERETELSVNEIFDTKGAHS